MREARTTSKIRVGVPSYRVQLVKALFKVALVQFSHLMNAYREMMATIDFTNKISLCKVGSGVHHPQGLPDGSDSMLLDPDDVLPPKYMEEDVVQPESKSDGEGGTEAPVVVGDIEALEMHYVPIPKGHVHAPARGIQMESCQQSGVIGTQESHIPFPKVFMILPSYFESNVEDGFSESDSSRSEWLGNLQTSWKLMIRRT